jgi:hypothetical protein
MFWKLAKTLMLALAILGLAPGLALAQVGGVGGSGGPGAPSSPGGGSSMGPGSSNPGSALNTPSQPSPGDNPGRSGGPSSPPPPPSTTTPEMRGPGSPGTFTTPEASRERELRQQGEAPRTEPSTDLNRRSERGTP